jgi:predicted DNA-binding protein
MPSELVRELAARALDQAPKVPTTIRIGSRTFERLKKQHRRWGISMSYIIERALEPVLCELERAKLPTDGDEFQPNDADEDGDRDG